MLRAALQSAARATAGQCAINRELLQLVFHDANPLLNREKLSHHRPIQAVRIFCDQLDEQPATTSNIDATATVAGRALVHALLKGGGATTRTTLPVSAGLLNDTGRRIAVVPPQREADLLTPTSTHSPPTGRAIPAPSSNGSRQRRSPRSTMDASWPTT